jgi:tubulin monoglycylase TTLL3/8
MYPESADLLWVPQKQVTRDLIDSQVANHFLKMEKLTAKIGLLRTFRDASSSLSMNVEKFFPRSFDMNNPHDAEEFEAEYKIGKAVSILKLWLQHIDAGKASEKTFPPEIVELALGELQTQLVVEDEDVNIVSRISAKAWEIIKEVDVDHPELSLEPLQALERQQELERRQKLVDEQVVERRKAQLAKLGDLIRVRQSGKRVKRREEKVHRMDWSVGEIAEPAEEDVVQKRESRPMPELRKAVRKTLEGLAASDPQFALAGTKHAWIVKPAGRARGEGIQIMRDVDQILRWTHKKRFVCQKYIENPLVINLTGATGSTGRKFDVRQWVFVKSWQPLEAFIWDEPYIRFAAEDYDPDKIVTAPVRGDGGQSQLNLFRHLTNNTISCTHADFKAESEEDSCMWSLAQFQMWLRTTYKRDVWTEDIVPQFEHIILETLRAGQDNIVARERSVEILGFDLMVSDDLRAWLLEVNSSPCLEPTTPLTRRLVPEVSADMVEIIQTRVLGLPSEIRDTKQMGWVETEEAEANRVHDDPATAQVGKWRRIVAEAAVDAEVRCFGAYGPQALLVEGHAVKEPPRVQSLPPLPPSDEEVKRRQEALLAKQKDMLQSVSQKREAALEKKRQSAAKLEKAKKQSRLRVLRTLKDVREKKKEKLKLDAEGSGCEDGDDKAEHHPSEESTEASENGPHDAEAGSSDENHGKD